MSSRTYVSQPVSCHRLVLVGYRPLASSRFGLRIKSRGCLQAWSVQYLPMSTHETSERLINVQGGFTILRTPHPQHTEKLRTVAGFADSCGFGSVRRIVLRMLRLAVICWCVHQFASTCNRVFVQTFAKSRLRHNPGGTPVAVRLTAPQPLVLFSAQAPP